MGVGALAHRALGSLSSGEQQRVFLARTLMNDPGVVVLDEPSAGLDLGGREQLVRALGELAAQPTGPPIVLVTHHVDEIPDGITHTLLLRDGRAVAQGSLDEALTSETLSDCYEMPLALERRPDGRLERVGSSPNGVTRRVRLSRPRRISSSSTRSSTPPVHSAPS